MRWYPFGRRLPETGSTNPSDMLAEKKERLLQEAVADEIVVYDPQTRRAHTLNPTLAVVFQACDGRTSYDDVLSRLGPEADRATIELALARLSEAGLLEDGASLEKVSRRSFLKKARVAAVLPALVTLSVPSPVAGASGPCYAAGDTEAEACLKCGAPAACGDPGAGMINIEYYDPATLCEGLSGVDSVNCSNPSSCSEIVIVPYRCA